MGLSWTIVRVKYAEKFRSTIRRLYLHTGVLPDDSVWSVVLRAVMGEKDLALVKPLSAEFPAELLKPGSSLALYRGPNLVATIEGIDPHSTSALSGVPDADSDSGAETPREAEPGLQVAPDNPGSEEDVCVVCGSRSCILSEEACREACEAYRQHVEKTTLPKVIKALSNGIPTDAEIAEQALALVDRVKAQRDEARARVKELEGVLEQTQGVHHRYNQVFEQHRQALEWLEARLSNPKIFPPEEERLRSLLRILDPSAESGSPAKSFAEHFVDVVQERMGQDPNLKSYLETARRRSL